jgi:MFS family permease
VRATPAKSITAGSFAVMLAPNAALGIVLAVMPAVLPQLARDIGGVKSAELVASVAAFGMVAGGFVSGRLLRRFGIQRVLIGSLGFFVACSLAGMLSADRWVLGTCRFTLGIAAVCFSTSALALTAVTFTGDARSRVIGLQQVTSQVVSVSAALLVGLAADLLNWRSSFVILALFGVSMLVAALRVENTRTTACVRDGGKVAAAFWRRLWPMLATAVLVGALTVVPMTQIPFLVSDIYRGSPTAISIVADLNFASAAVSALFYSQLKSHFGGSVTYALGLCIGACGIAMSGFAGSLVVFCIGSAWAGFGTGIYNSFVFDRGVELAGESRQADAAGLLFALISLGAAVNPLLLAPFEVILGEHVALIGFGLAALIGGLLLSWSCPYQAGHAEG